MLIWCSYIFIPFWHDSDMILIWLQDSSQKTTKQQKSQLWLIAKSQLKLYIKIMTAKRSHKQIIRTKHIWIISKSWRCIWQPSILEAAHFGTPCAKAWLPLPKFYVTVLWCSNGKAALARSGRSHPPAETFSAGWIIESLGCGFDSVFPPHLWLFWQNLGRMRKEMYTLIEFRMHVLPINADIRMRKHADFACYKCTGWAFLFIYSCIYLYILLYKPPSLSLSLSLC